MNQNQAIKMTMKNLVFMMVFCAASAMTVFPQETQITESDYFQAYHTAAEKKSETPMRYIKKVESFENGVLSETRDTVQDILSTDKMRHLETIKIKDKITTRELIQIGRVYYCRKNKEEWTTSDRWCAGMMISALPNIITSKFTVKDTKLNNQPAKLYERYLTYKNEYSPKKDEEGMSYLHSKFWLNAEGFFLRRETKWGLSEPARVYEQQSEIFEYNVKSITIEAPIK